MKLDLQYCARSANLLQGNERQKHCHSPLKKFASCTKIAMKVKIHYGIHTTFFGKLQTGSIFFFHTTVVHSVSALVTAP